ncbi:hypothetical protein DMC64_41570 [Amycolatopsis sp. WAC 04197]|uniref:LamG-like jellyroll fold domain-containing protein n=1 Tax=Amycolatopsis sp. WAC 04197 TaxID=2203199 RepID=UPI000F7AEF50|nr:LamG-like jellyroll fold domain-containing protein [Amycolatopsis sp. WAC 04197]RSN38560.1 hypothetical protein DMC64_41570 [Amycolatopsis sp. WAC 04197]
MSFAFVKSLGTNGSSSTVTTGLSITVPAGGVPAGDLLVLRFASFNYRAGSTPPTVTDSRGNTWQQDFARTSSSDGMNIVYSAVIATALLAGDLISVGFTANNANYALAVDQFSGAAPSGWRWMVDPTGTKAVTTTPTNSLAPTSPYPTYTLVLGVLFVPLPSTDAYTEDGNQAGGDSWHTLPGAFSPAGSTTQAVRASYKIPALGSTGALQSWSPTLGTAKTALETLVIYQGRLVPVTVADVAEAARTGNPREATAIGVSLATDVPAASRAGAPESKLAGTAPEPITLLDVPFASQAGAPEDMVAIDVPLGIDVPAAARSGAPADEVAIGVTVDDVPFPGRAGSPVDGPVLIGVTVHDTVCPARSGAPGAALAIGVTLFTDRPTGARGGAPAAAIGNTVTNDAPAASRAGAPTSTLGGAGLFPVAPSSLTGDIPNPNRPLLIPYADFTVGPPKTVGFETRSSLNSQARRTVARKISIQRGRQYELDQVQAGTATFEITDPLENLNPVNTASPLNQGGRQIKPYRAMRVTALWPNTGNMINKSLIGDAADASFETGFGKFVPSGAGTTQATSTTQFWTGTRSMQVTQTTAGRGFGVNLPIVVGPDLLMVMSAYVKPTSGTTVQLRIIDAAGIEHNSNVATAQDTWTRVFVSWRAVDMVEKVEIFGSGGAPTRYYVDAVQLEFGLNPTLFTTEGPEAYRLYSGYIERYPLHYDMHGTRGIRPLTAVDALAILSRTEIAESYQATISADGPNLIAPLNDASGPQRIQRPTGGAPMAGYTQLGSNSASVNWGGDSFLDGTPALSITQQNTTPPVKADIKQVTYVGTRGGSISMNPRAFTYEGWFRFLDGCIYFGLGSMKRGERTDTVDTVYGPQYGITMFTTGGRLGARFNDPNGGEGPLWIVETPNYSAFPDDDWHYFAIVFSNGNWSLYIDAVPCWTNSPLGFTPSASVQLDNMFFDVTTVNGDPVSTASFANFATYPYALSAAQVTTHYQRGSGYNDERCGDRVGRLLTKYWAGPWKLAFGRMRLAADTDYTRRMLLDVLQEIQESERGLLYADQGGLVVFDDRDSRYRGEQQIPAVVFGEDTAAGEIPYEDYEGDVDPTYVFSQANLTRPGNNEFPPMVNAAAKADYGQRILSHNVQATNDFDLSQAGTFYLARYGRAKLRVEKLALNPVAYPAAWGPLLSLELGRRVTIRRRSGQLVMSGDYYVEQINHAIDADAGTWRIELQCSPVFVPSAWVLGDPQYGVLGSTTTPIY